MKLTTKLTPTNANTIQNTIVLFLYSATPTNMFNNASPSFVLVTELPNRLSTPVPAHHIALYVHQDFSNFIFTSLKFMYLHKVINSLEKLQHLLRSSNVMNNQAKFSGVLCGLEIEYLD